MGTLQDASVMILTIAMEKIMIVLAFGFEICMVLFLG